MRKFLKALLSILIIVTLICLVLKLDILEFLTLNVDESKLSLYSGYYYNQLNLEEKKIYVLLDEGIKNRETKIAIGSQQEDVKKTVNRVLMAYFYDNPNCYHISNEYVIYTQDLKVVKYSTIELKYLVAENTVDVKSKEIEKVVNELINDNIESGMSDFEKELVLHDALVKRVEYYEYEDIKDIPSIKHTAYGALVEKEAVCDGYAKALKILLDKVGINNIIITGMVDGIAHAWNVVMLDDEYYHVDSTSNKLGKHSDKYIIHRYFNVTDEELDSIPVSDLGFEYPKCYATKYDYYNYLSYYIESEDNLYDKLGEIIMHQKNTPILEIKLGKQYKVRRIIDTLYNLNFANWQQTGKSSVAYTQVDDVYVFIK